VRDPLQESRLRLEASVGRLRAALQSEFGAAPRLGRWALVLLAAAAGFALASRVPRRRRRLRAR
jgi:hypothetical protein